MRIGCQPRRRYSTAVAADPLLCVAVPSTPDQRRRRLEGSLHSLERFALPAAVGVRRAGQVAVSLQEIVAANGRRESEKLQAGGMRFASTAARAAPIAVSASSNHFFAGSSSKKYDQSWYLHWNTVHGVPSRWAK